MGALAVTVLVCGSGCNRVKQAVAEQANNDPNLRAKAVESARTSCTQGAQTSFPQIANRDQIITEYCDCFATKGLNTFSNADLVSIGFSGLNSMTPEQKKKLEDAAKMCVEDTRTKQQAKP